MQRQVKLNRFRKISIDDNEGPDSELCLLESVEDLIEFELSSAEMLSSKSPVKIKLYFNELSQRYLRILNYIYSIFTRASKDEEFTINISRDLHMNSQAFNIIDRANIIEWSDTHERISKMSLELANVYNDMEEADSSDGKTTSQFIMCFRKSINSLATFC